MGDAQLVTVLGVVVELSPKQNIDINPANALQKRRVERMQELEDGDGGCGMLSCGLDVTTALMNSQELWLPAQNQTCQHSSRAGGRAHEAPPLAEELFAIDGCGGGKAIFL